MKPWWRRWFGTRSERAAEAYLRKSGMRILARNVTIGEGELDLVALEGRTIVFAEVRSTEDSDLTRPSESVDAAKQAKVSAAALAWLKAKNLLGHVLSVLADHTVNVIDMVNKSRAELAFNIVDVEHQPSAAVVAAIEATAHVIRVRVIDR